MAELIDIHIPDIGDFDDVDVTEVLIKPGDRIETEQSLLVLESDKASMEVPAPGAGVIREVLVEAGAKVKQGDVVARMEADGDTAPSAAPPPAPAVTTSTATAPPPAGPGSSTKLLVLGGGPGGYTAAFRAADLGLEVTLVEREPQLGGVCLNVGCIPSKALLHAAKVIDDAHEMESHGIRFGQPTIELEALRDWKQSVVDRLTGGLSQMAKQRGVTVIHGTARLTSPTSVAIETKAGEQALSFEQAILAVGSRVVQIPGIPWDDPRVIDSTGALALEDIPGRLLVIGGGIIGLEMATVYAALGSKVTIVELMDGLMPGADRDLVRPLAKRLGTSCEAILTSTKVAKVEVLSEGLRATFEGKNAPEPQTFDRVLVAVGRRPNGDRVGAEAAGLRVDERGFVPVDAQQRTNVPHIFAIGDLVGNPMLAHKASHEGKAAAEIAAGHHAGVEARAIPSVAYTDPEVAWVGLTETDAKAKGIEVGVGRFPWAASGRALSLGRSDGFTKILFDPTTKRVLGGGIVGPSAGDLIAEVGLALEMGADAEDLGLTIHPHPTLSETVAFAAEVFEGTITDLYLGPKRGRG